MTNRQESASSLWLGELGGSGWERSLDFADFLREESRGIELHASSGSRRSSDDTARILSIFRKFVGFILENQLDSDVCHVYLMAYDFGVAEGLCGANSAVSVGMRKGLRDAMHVATTELSPRLVGKSEELGRHHGMLVRQLIQGDPGSEN